MRSLLFFTLLLPLTMNAQTASYHDDDALTAELKQLVSKHSELIAMESIAKTAQGRDLWAVRIGDPKNKAMLVVGGIEGTSLVGTEHALRFIAHLVSGGAPKESVAALLKKTTVYVIPRANPDAAETYFGKPQRERETNFEPADDDRDAAVDEDDVDDVNKDGLITWMRVKDPRGEWIIDPDDARLMRKADASKGERGQYRLLSEGVDNDKDQEWNEDPAGGTDLNRNFSYNFQFFGKGSGLHQISATESKAIADFLFDHPTIGTVFTFSSNDNLLTPWKNEPPKGDGPAITSVAKDDEEYFSAIAKRFTEVTALSNAPKPARGEGAFSEWAYYHAGRWSFAVRPWWPGDVAVKKDTAAAKDSVKRSGEMKKGEKEKGDNADLKLIKWYEAAGITDPVRPWKRFEHPDFPDKEVEIGGLRPFISSNPPAESLASVAKPFENFLTVLAAQLPSLSLANQKVEKLGANVYRVSVDVVNDGFLPTNSALGVKTRWVRNVRVTLDAGKSTISSGMTKQILDPIKGSGGFKTLSWVVVGKGSVSIHAESPVAGAADMTVEVK